MSSLEINRPGMRRLKKASALILTLCLAGLTLTGCNNQPITSTDASTEISTGTSTGISSGINAPVIMNYTVNNPLVCEEIIDGNGQEFDYRYVKVSGLADKEVEKKVNDKIKAVYDELRIQDLPPYRGIKTKIPENYIASTETIYVNVAGNFNNILSIMFSKYASYQDPALKVDEKDKAYYDGSKYFSEAETLNFDLRTGEEIKLKDLFCDDVDYRKLINEYMSDYLSENYAEDEGYYMGSFGELKLVESFKGLAEDQKFVIYPFGISFVFDYRTPQFDTGSAAVSPLINYSEFGDNIAAAARFYDEKSTIFTSDEPLVKTFVSKSGRNDIAGSNYVQQGTVNVYQNWSYSSKFPEEIRNMLDQMKEVDEDKVKSIQEIYSAMSAAEIEKIGPGAYEIMVYGERTGNFINISKYSNVYHSNYYEQVSEFHCFNGETMEELKLEDIFRENYDYKPVILDAMRKAIDSYDGTYDAAGEDTVGRYSEEQYEEAFNRISGFNLAVDSLNIPVLHPEMGAQAYGLTVYIPYRDIGCDNMNIFD